VQCKDDSHDDESNIYIFQNHLHHNKSSLYMPQKEINSVMIEKRKIFQMNFGNALSYAGISLFSKNRGL